MARNWFLLAIVGLFSTAVFSADLSKPWNDYEYQIKLQNVLDILLESFTIEIRNNENVLIFSIPSLTDVYFIYDSMDEATKEEVISLLPAFEKSQTTLVISADVEINLALSYEMRIKTIFYEKAEEMNDRKLIMSLFSTYFLPSQRFASYLTYVDNDSHTKNALLRLAGLDMKSETCSIKYCPVQQIVSSKPPFAILTLATWKITSVDLFQWTENVEFAVSDTLRPRVKTARAVASCDYAEFKYPTLKHCTGRVLRLPYMQHFNLFFVIPSDEKRCSSSEDLWKNVRNANLNGLKYETKRMFVSIPLFNVSANIDWKMKLKGSVFEQVFDQPSSRLYNAMALQAVEVVFSPTFPEMIAIPSIHGDTPKFFAERPFIFALLHNMSQQPVVAGLINSPWCNSNCG